MTSTSDVPASPRAAHLPVSAGVPTTWAVKACNNAGCGVKSNIVSMTCN